jgi:hypothetical protein
MFCASHVLVCDGFIPFYITVVYIGFLSFLAFIKLLHLYQVPSPAPDFPATTIAEMLLQQPLINYKSKTANLIDTIIRSSVNPHNGWTFLSELNM